MRPWTWILLLPALGCDPNAFGPQPTVTDTGSSPSASVLPRLDDPAISAFDGGLPRRADGGADAGLPAPTPLPSDRRLGADRIVPRDLAGVVLDARWVHRDVVGTTSSPQLDDKALTRARAETEGGWRITLTSSGRMEMEITARAQPLPPGTRLLGRQQSLGWVLVWPDGDRYRVIPPGAARAMLNESRTDVSPAATVELELDAEGERLGFPTQTATIRTPVGEVMLELATIDETGPAGTSLCRMLVELAGATPSPNMCTHDEIPIRASYRWSLPDGEARGVTFEVTGIERRTDLDWRAFRMPPAGAKLVRTGLPPNGTFFEPDELRTFRTGPGASPNPPDPRAPEEGLVASNRSDRLLYLWVDGVPITTVRPWQERAVVGLLPGRYRMQWRSFLDDFVEQPSEHDLPARLRHGEPPDAEAPDAGG